MAVDLLRRAQVIGYPTEAVFGLGCDPRSADALESLIRAKGRDRSKGLILVAAGVEQLLGFMGRLEGVCMATMLGSWPGPCTWVVPAALDVHPLVTGGRRSVAVRVTAHPLTRLLCHRFGGAIVSTSANRAGAAPARSASILRRRLGHRVAMVLDGSLGCALRPSTIRDVRTGAVLREGDASAG